MSLTLSIKRGSLFRKAPGLAELRKHLGSFLYIGGQGDFSIFQDTLAPPALNGDLIYMMYGRMGPVGRGFTLAMREGGARLELCCPLPTTTHDLEDFFTAAEALAKALGSRELHEESGGTVSLSGLTARFAEMRARNGHILKSFVAGGHEGLVVGGAAMPLYLPESLCRHIGSVPPKNAEVFFSDYLDQKQTQHYAYMKPAFQRREDGGAVAEYTLTAGVASIIPRRGFVPYPPSPVAGEEVAAWQVLMLTPAGENLGRMPYEGFVAALEEAGEVEEFDPMHYTIYGLKRQRMRELLAGQ